MELDEVRARAEEIGIISRGRSKKALIHRIQAAELNDECFGESGEECPYGTCCWKTDCLSEPRWNSAKKTLRPADAASD